MPTPPLTPDTIRLALRDCYDPNLPCNLIDLGLLHHITLTLDPHAPGANIPGVPPRYRIHIDLLSTATPEPSDAEPISTPDSANAQLIAQIQNRLSAFPSVLATTVTLLTNPTWSPARITPAGRRLLGLDGHPNLIQITPKPTP